MAIKKSTPAKIFVYSPDGEKEEHTLPNARDLVNGAGYSWHPTKETTPASIAPFAVPVTKKFAKSAAQEVLDSVGSGTGEGTSVDAPAAVEEAIDEEEVEETPEEVTPRRRRKPTPVSE